MPWKAPPMYDHHSNPALPVQKEVIMDGDEHVTTDVQSRGFRVHISALLAKLDWPIVSSANIRWRAPMTRTHRSKHMSSNCMVEDTSNDGEGVINGGVRSDLASSEQASLWPLCSVDERRDAGCQRAIDGAPMVCQGRSIRWPRRGAAQRTVFLSETGEAKTPLTEVARGALSPTTQPRVADTATGYLVSRPSLPARA